MSTILVAMLAAVSWPLVALAQGPGCCRAGSGVACCMQVAKANAEDHAAEDDNEVAAEEPAHPDGPAGGMMGMTAAEHGNIFNLLSDHKTITRKVEEVEGGVKTITTTTEPALVETLRAHVRQMARRVRDGRPVRLWDPAFRDVFAHYDEIELTFRDVEGGIEVIETSENPKAADAIRAHATKVNTFVEGGHAAARPPWAGGAGRGPGMGRGPGAGRGPGRAGN